MLKRQLEVMSTAGAAVDQFSYMEVVRAAAEAGLLQDTQRFRDYREKRNITSHTYDAEQAESIVAVLPAFAAESIPCWPSWRGGTLNALSVTPEELEIILQILGRLVPDREVRAFGSRVTGTPKKFSDLDLVLMGEASLRIAVRADLREAFIESALPFRVDLVDWSTTDGRFREIIRASSIVLQAGRPG